MQITI